MMAPLPALEWSLSKMSLCVLGQPPDSPDPHDLCSHAQGTDEQAIKNQSSSYMAVSFEKRCSR